MRRATHRTIVATMDDRPIRTEPAGRTASRAEFPVPFDRESYFIPTVGIFFLGAIAGGIVLIVAGPLLAVPDALVPAFLTVPLLGSGGLAATWWVRRRMRIHRERKLVLDDAGITYYAFAGRGRSIRWDDVVRADERAFISSDGDYYTLVFQLRGRTWSGGRTFTIDSGDFTGYGHIRRLVRARLPDRTALARTDG